jgi:hypothetical protein
MKIKKSHLKVAIEALAGSDELTLRDSRTRDRAIKTLNASHEEYIGDQKKVIHQFCERGADGEPDVKIKNGQTFYSFSSEDGIEYKKESELLNEEKISFKPSQEVISFIEETNYNPKVGEADIIYEVLDGMKKEIKTQKAKASNKPATKKKKK